MGKNDVPRFFSLPQSTRVSFKVPGKKSRQRKLSDGNSIPDDAIVPRQDYIDDFEIDENSQLNIPKSYTPEQTYNYKSAWKRYEKGMELVQSGKVFEDKDNPGDYKVLSSGAPKGYWEVKQGDGNDGEEPVKPEIVSVTWGRSWDFVFPDTRERIINNDAMGDDVNLYDSVPLFGNWIDLSGVEDYGNFKSWINKNNYILFPELPYKSIKGYVYTSSVPSLVGSGAVVFHVFVIKLETEIIRLGTLIGSRSFEPGEVENLISFLIINYADEPSENFPLTQNPTGIGSGNDQNQSGGDGNSGDYKCNCPDSSKEKYLSPTETSGNEPLYEEWKSSNAGAQNGQCKHFWAVKILRNEVLPEDIPSDMPISENFPNKNGETRNPKVIGQRGGLGFDNWNPNKQIRKK